MELRKCAIGPSCPLHLWSGPDLDLGTVCGMHDGFHNHLYTSTHARRMSAKFVESLITEHRTDFSVPKRGTDKLRSGTICGPNACRKVHRFPLS